MKLTQEQAIAVQLGLYAMSLQTLMAKRKDYSGEDDPYRNLRTAEAVGCEAWRGVQVRCMDKKSRRRTYMENAGEMRIKSEKFQDPFFDELNYICIEAGLAIEAMDRQDLLDDLTEAAETLTDIINDLKISV